MGTRLCRHRTRRLVLFGSLIVLGGCEPLVYAVAEDNHVVGVESKTLSREALEPGATFAGTVSFSIWSASDEPPVEFTSEPTAVFIWQGGDATTALPFTANAQVTAAGSHIDVAAGVSFEVRRFSTEGSLQRIARVAREPVAVDASTRSEFREFVQNERTAARRDAALDALDHPAVPESMPAYRLLVGGTDGSTWAYRYAPIPTDQPWDVFLPDGSFAGPVTVPAAFRLTAATSEFILGYWTDGLGVHHVRRYRIIGA